MKSKGMDKHEREQLLARAASAVVMLNEMALQGDKEGIEAAVADYDAVIVELNGGTSFGSMADTRAAGRVVQRYCAARMGDVPIWGQSGVFLSEQESMRAVVHFERISGDMHRVEFNAVDSDKPFLSDTGYLSRHLKPAAGVTVESAVDSAFKEARSQNGAVALTQATVEKMSAQVVPSWLRRALNPGSRQKRSVRRAVPPGFVEVDVILPPHLAYIVRRWAADAEAKLNSATALPNKPHNRP